MQIATAFHRTETEVYKKLDALRLQRHRLLSVGAVALASSRRASAFHPANSRGTFGYHDGVEALRGEHVPRDGWALYAVGGLEGIYNEEIKTIILFKNMDRCCNEKKKPQAASRIGINSERICGCPLFESVGIALPEVVFIPLPNARHVKTSKYSVYYLMIDPNGNLELSSPVIKDRVIQGFTDRIFLAEGDDLDLDLTLPDVGPMDGDEFVIEVKRKNEQ